MINKEGGKEAPEKPAQPCHICKGSEFWLRDKGWGKPEWLCQTYRACHYDGEITWYEVNEGSS